VLDLYGYDTANIGKLHFKNHAATFRDHREPHPSYGFDTLVLSDEPGCYDDAYIKWVEEHDPAAVELCRASTPPAWTGTPIKKHARDTASPYLFEGPEELTHTAFVAEETIEYIRRSKHKPFFCIAGFYAPHCPVDPPKRFADMFDVDAMPLPHRNEGEGAHVSDDQWRKIVAYYHALCSHVDDQAGRILRELDDLGLTDDTIVIFTSDHGEHLGDHGRTSKGQAWDSSSRVPLIVSYPRAFGSLGRKTEIIEHVDIVPTILDWCGIQQPPFMQGRSFRALIEGGDYTPRTSAFMEIKNPLVSSWKAVRTHEYLYVNDSKRGEQLYDQQEDPHQLTNVAADASHSPLLAEARNALLSRWFDVEKQYPQRVAQY
jgi:arylsulfatase A-like enzyme